MRHEQGAEQPAQPREPEGREPKLISRPRRRAPRRALGGAQREVGAARSASARYDSTTVARPWAIRSFRR